MRRSNCVWRQRRYRCLESACPVGGFSEDHDLAGQRSKLTTRAAWWAISAIQRDTASVAAVARRLGVDWHTVWDAIKPLLAELADDPARLLGIDTLGVDEHIWHHRPRPGKPPKELTGIVDLTRHNGRPKARLLDLVPGRSGKAYADWLTGRGEPFTTGIGVATLDPFRGYGNAIRDEFEDATAVLDAFHVVKLGATAMEETRRRVQQEQLGHRGRKTRPALPDPQHPPRRCRAAHRTPARTPRTRTRSRRPRLRSDRRLALLPATPLGLPRRQS